MIAILVAKWVADALEREGVYDLAQTVLGHPFLDLDHSLSLAQKSGESTEVLLPPSETMAEITVNLPPNGCVSRGILSRKLQLLKRRGLMDAGLVLVSEGMLQGYLNQGELDFGINELGKTLSANDDAKFRLISKAGSGDRHFSDSENFEIRDRVGEVDLSQFVDRTPMIVFATAPVEYAVAMFGSLGLKYLCVVEERSGKVVGVRRSLRSVWINANN